MEHSSTSPDSQARQDTDHGSTSITVSVGVLSEGDDPIGFYVEDDGPGVPDAKRDRIFERGFSTRADATGFGLTIVETIADAHGWTVSLADTAEEAGARFEVTGVEFRN